MLTTTVEIQDTSIEDADYKILMHQVRLNFEKFDKVNLFTTNTSDLYQVFLDNLPEDLRQKYTCRACNKFIDTYGGIVTISTEGEMNPILWDISTTPVTFSKAIKEIVKKIRNSRITGVFLSEDKVWGLPTNKSLKGQWYHLSVNNTNYFKPTLQTAFQKMAEKKQDYETLCRWLTEFPYDIVNKAYVLLTNDSLYRSEKCIGVAKWLVDIMEKQNSCKNFKIKENIIWNAVATAPPGFCHIKSTMIGTLLEDLQAELPFDQIKAKFNDKMNPLQYQRPSTITDGNIAQAEKIIEKLKSAGSLQRRFAKLDDLQKLWVPTVNNIKSSDGVFDHLKSNQKSSKVDLKVPSQTMTWEKFSKTVLPTAEKIEYYVSDDPAPYAALISAKNPEAPPIVQWDSEENRNTVTWYVYHNGSFPSIWNLHTGKYVEVTAVVLAPYMWDSTKDISNQSKRVFFILNGAKDTRHLSGGGFFPEQLKSEYHSIRSTLEAYAKNATIEGKNSAEACGLCLQSASNSWSYLFRVTSRGVILTYKLDRWD